MSDWIATTYNLYWTNESTYTPETKPPTAKSSLNDSAYRSNRSLAELAVKTYFGPAQFAVFKEFGDWVEGGFMRAFSEGEPLSFTEFHAKSEELLGSLQRETW